MGSPLARRLLALLLGCVAACAHQKNVMSKAVAPATAAPRSVMTEEEIERAPGRSIEQLLMDPFPGVQVTRTSDGGISVRIRGVGSFLSSNEPLYLIDEVPMDLGRGASLRAINPHDIASIEVVQDPVGMALYGVRGANGVVIIKTKRPGR
jgi:TonB-dependent SusC/RagA subfamily outer membrane receptor